MIDHENIIKLAREAAARHGHTLKDRPEPETVEFIVELVAMAAAAEREAIESALTDPENQPSQWGTVTIEHMEQQVAAEREACAKVCDSLVDRAEAGKARQRIGYARTAGDEEDELRAMRHELTVSTYNAGISKCAAEIRARSQQA